MIRKFFLPINICLFISCMVASCGKKLDQFSPDTSISENEIRAADIPLLINGIYSRMQGNPYYTYPMFDIYADDIISIQGGTGTRFNPQNFEACSALPSDAFGIGPFYNSSYTAIGNANFIINFIRGRNLSNMNKELGEALAVRAFCYYRLVDAFGGVIITLGGDKDPSELKRKKNTETEVYQQIFTDLTDAEKLLPSFTTSTAMSKEALQLLRARIHLNRGEKTEAKKYAEAVISSTAVGLTSNFTSNFRYDNAGNKELLFRTHEGPLQYSYDKGTMFLQYSPGLPYRRPNGATGYGQTWVNPALVAAYEPGDVRAGMLKDQFASAAGKVVTFLMKHSADTLQTANPVVTYPMIRLSEAYLISAEVDARNGLIDVTRYNQLRQKRNLPAKNNSDFTDAAAFLEEVEWERRREFLGESLRWQDMKRFGKAIPFLASKGQDENKLKMPLPAAEIARNPNLEQNKGYDF